MYFYFVMSQNLYLTFTGNGEATVVDSVTATNLTTGEFITMPGENTLVLSTSVGVDKMLRFLEGVKLYQILLRIVPHFWWVRVMKIGRRFVKI